MAARPRRRRSSPARCRIITAPCCSARALSARARCRPSCSCPAMARCASPPRATTRPPAAPSRPRASSPTSPSSPPRSSVSPSPRGGMRPICAAPSRTPTRPAPLASRARVAMRRPPTCRRAPRRSSRRTLRGSIPTCSAPPRTISWRARSTCCAASPCSTPRPRTDRIARRGWPPSRRSRLRPAAARIVAWQPGWLHRPPPPAPASRVEESLPAPPPVAAASPPPQAADMQAAAAVPRPVPPPETPPSDASAHAAPPEPAAAPPPASLASEQALVEPGPDGPLPIIAPDGREAWRVYARPFDRGDKRPRLAIVVFGLGLSTAPTETSINELPGAVTLAFEPYARQLPEWIERARAAGHEILLTVPMEPADYPRQDPGPYTLLTSLDAKKNQRRLDWVLSRATGYVGVANIMGARFTGSRTDLLLWLEELRKRGHKALPRLDSHRTPDGDATQKRIASRHYELAEVARRSGGALGVVHDHP